jgi:MerR family transcriptional regulator, redox-sensitive transcriptional activator SoxR
MHIELFRRPCCAGLRSSSSRRENGLTLEEIGAELAKLPADRIPTSRDWARLSGKWTKRIDQRIAELNRLRAGLTQCIGCGCLSIDKCKLANPADRAGRKGPGPRYWLG